MRSELSSVGSSTRALFSPIGRLAAQTRIYSRAARAQAGTGGGRESKVTPEAVRVFKRARRLDAAGLERNSGPRSREYYAARAALRRALGRATWQAHPLDVDDGRDPPNPQWDAAGAAELRRQFDVGVALLERGDELINISCTKDAYPVTHEDLQTARAARIDALLTYERRRTLAEYPKPDAADCCCG